MQHQENADEGQISNSDRARLSADTKDPHKCTYTLCSAFNDYQAHTQKYRHTSSQGGIDLTHVAAAPLEKPKTPSKPPQAIQVSSRVLRLCAQSATTCASQLMQSLRQPPLATASGCGGTGVRAAAGSLDSSMTGHCRVPGCRHQARMATFWPSHSRSS